MSTSVNRQVDKSTGRQVDKSVSVVYTNGGGDVGQPDLCY